MPTLGQRIVAKIKSVDKCDATTEEAKEAFIASVIDEAFAEVAAKYVGVLRDKFAGDALIATLSHEKNMVCLGAGQTDEIYSMAQDCYLMAEAMLKAREP